MKNLIKVAAAVSLASLSTVADAAIVIGGVTPGTAVYSGPAPTYDFDSTTPPTVGGIVDNASVSGVRAQPYGSTGNYYAVGIPGPNGAHPGVIDFSSFGDIVSLSFIWGSVDSYNTLQFLDAGGGVLASFTGSNVFNPANGNQTDPNTNPLVTFLLSGSDVSAFSQLRLSSSSNAFEIDNIAVNAVPEPGTWALMLLGFGAVGFSMRRRKQQHIPALA